MAYILLSLSSLLLFFFFFYYLVTFVLEN